MSLVVTLVENTLLKRARVAFAPGIAVALLGAALTTGCETERVRVGTGSPTTPWSDIGPRKSRERDLREKTEKDPQDPKGWFDYGAYWEESGDLTKAIQCYERGNELIDGQNWTGGNYLLGRSYFQMRDFVQAMRHLDLVTAIESPDAKVACLNNQFAEAHFIKGSIYYLSQNWRKARTEYLRFLELGGEDSRVEELLDRVERELR